MARSLDALRVNCKCGSALKILSDQADKVIKCPGCARKFRVPAAKFAAAAARRRSTICPKTSRKTATAPVTPSSAAADPLPVSLDDELLRGISDGDFIERESLSKEFGLHIEAPPLRTPGNNPVPDAQPGGPTCPACGRTLTIGAKICVQCGIDIKTGRSLLTTEEGHLDSVYIAAEQTIRIISWLFWTGIYPIASEGFGTRKPWAVRTCAILTILISVLFWCFEWSESPAMRSGKYLMLWGGNKPPSPQLIYAMYTYTPYGNSEAFFDRMDELEDEEEEAKVAESGQQPLSRSPANDFDPTSYLFDDGELLNEKHIVEAHNSLSPRDQAIGRFRLYQLLTNAFLHSDILHLAGNLLFLMVFGSRVNALVGNIKAAILYPVLAILASIGHLISVSDSEPIAALGASGAIMGLAGMYFVIFPVHKVHMVAWWRWGFIRMFKLSYKTFSLRGFWVVLVYIALDIVATVLGAEDGVAHWAHLSGFGFGVAIALILLIARQVNGRGGDVLSAILGRHAWAIIGKPRA